MNRLNRHTSKNTKGFLEAKRLLKDWLSCLVYAYGKRSADEFFSSYFESEKWRESDTMRSVDRSFLLGYLSHYHEFDDSEFFGETHPSAVVFSALLSLPGDEKSVEHLLESAYYGMSSLLFFGPYFNPRHYGSGWHGTGTLGSIAATLACCHFLEFSDNEKLSALKSVSTLLSGNHLVFASPSKFLNSARASQNAIVACQIVRSMPRFEPMTDEDFKRLVELYSGNPHPHSPHLESNLNFIHSKTYPLCHCLVPVVENFLELVKSESLRAGDIKSVSLHLSSYSRKILHYDQPQNNYEIGFSPEFCLWLCLQEQDVNFSSFLNCEESVSAFHSQKDRIHVQVDPNLEFMDHQVEIETISAVIKKEFSFNRGFISGKPPDLTGKFNALTEFAICDKKAYSELIAVLDDEKQAGSLRRLRQLVNLSFDIKI